MNQSTIVIELVHGGYVLATPTDAANGEARLEVFTSTAKLNKAVRDAITEFTLVSKKEADAAE